MGVKRQWKIQKITSLPIAEEVRNQLITDIMRRKKPTIRVCAWDVHDGIAEEAFFQQQTAIYDWYTKQRLWEAKTPPKGVLIYEWPVPVDILLRSAEKEKIVKVPVSQERKFHVGISPSSLHEDMQRILANAPSKN